jgi:NTP pyrophosphatase (non-canonical NTP hydrolase)
MNYQLQMQPINLTPEIKPELLEQMRQIYMCYTGSEVAEAIKAIRVEIEQYQEAIALDQELADIIARKTIRQKSSRK